MEKRMYLSLTIIGILILLAVPILSAHTQTIQMPNNTTPKSKNQIDMLIFLSPQYENDKEIINSIKSYINTVKEDIGWNTKILTINHQNNNYKLIDQIIESYHSLYQIKTCIMVGEDIDTALAGDTDYMEKPSTIPWSTIGGETSYETSKQGIVTKPYSIDIAISLMYPTHNLDFKTKKSQIIYAFDKFSKQRNNHLKEILVFESSDINKQSKDLYQQINNYGKIVYKEDPTDINSSLNKEYSMYLVHGHSNPSGTVVKSNNTGWFSADNVNKVKSPFFGADGCYVNGWWSSSLDNNTLDPSINNNWYGSKIFTSDNVKVMVLGLLSQNGFSYPISFIENALPELLQGKTVAESIIDNIYVDNTIIVGDPTFHYT